MALNNQKNFIVAGIVILLAAVGAAAWIHESNRPAAANDYSAQLTPNGQPYNPNYAAAAPPAVSTGEGYYPLTERPAYIRQPQAAYAPASGPDADDQYADQQGPEYRTYRERHHGRSKKHSIEIVAGTAAAGAAIGAIAGGGKGAAIGGVSGAGAGFAYDRLTHNH